MAIPEEAVAVCNGTALPMEESRVHPAKVRVKFIESQSVAQVTQQQPPSPLDDDYFPPSEDMTEYHYNPHISQESGLDNPFRPDGELSREADTIVSLIKEGKPITANKGQEPLTNGYHHDTMDGMLNSPADGQECQEVVVNSTTAAEARAKSGANGTTPAKPGVVEVQRGVVVSPSDAPQVEQVIIKKKSKCHCCIVQ